MKKETRFTTKSGKEIVLKPLGGNSITKSQFVYNAAFKEALDNGCILKSKLIDYMEKQGLWDDEKNKSQQELLIKLADLEKQLNTGKNLDGDKLSVSEGKELALELHKERQNLAALISEQTALHSKTAESLADNARFNFLLVASAYDYKTQKPCFASLDDYLEKGDEADSMEIAAKFAQIFYDVDPDHDKTLTEYKFLKRFNFIDEDGNFIDETKKDEPKEEPEDILYDVMEAEFVEDKPKRARRKKAETK